MVSSTAPYIDFGTTEAVLGLFGSFYNQCMLFSNRRIKCMGTPVGTTDTADPTTMSYTIVQNIAFVPLPFSDGISVVDVGKSHHCVIFASGKVVCPGGVGGGFGNPPGGYQDGDKTTYGIGLSGSAGYVWETPPVRLSETSTPIHLATGDYSTCTRFFFKFFNCFFHKLFFFLTFSLISTRCYFPGRGSPVLGLLV